MLQQAGRTHQVTKLPGKSPSLFRNDASCFYVSIREQTKLPGRVWSEVRELQPASSQDPQFYPEDTVPIGGWPQSPQGRAAPVLSTPKSPQSDAGG